MMGGCGGLRCTSGGVLSIAVAYGIVPRGLCRFVEHRPMIV